MTTYYIAACQVQPPPGETCPVDEWISLDQAVDFSDLGITGPNIASVVGWGFGVVVLLWFFGYCINVALALIRKV